MPVDLPIQGQDTKKEWTVTGRFVLVSIVLFFLVIASVNALMMTLAIRTFPGADAKNGYDKSQNYNREIAAARAQAERGWIAARSIARRDGLVLVGLSIRSKDGTPVSGLDVEAQFRHPSDKKLDRIVPLTEGTAGSYNARHEGISPGAWSVRLVGKRGDEIVHVSDDRVTLR